MSAPQWSPVDDDTADLLTLVSDEGHPSADYEWDLFTEAVVTASLFDGVVRPNDLRPLIRGRVAPKRIGAFTHRALAEGLIEWRGDWEVSDDREGRNAGRPAKVYHRPRITTDAAGAPTLAATRGPVEVPPVIASTASPSDPGASPVAPDRRRGT